MVIFHKVSAIETTCIISWDDDIPRIVHRSRRIHSPLSSIFRPIRRSDALFLENAKHIFDVV